MVARRPTLIQLWVNVSCLLGCILFVIASEFIPRKTPKRWSNGILMLGHRLRLRPNIKKTSDQRLGFLGYSGRAASIFAQTQKAVSAYLESERIPPFRFAGETGEPCQRGALTDNCVNPHKNVRGMCAQRVVYSPPPRSAYLAWFCIPLRGREGIPAR